MRHTKKILNKRVWKKYHIMHWKVIFLNVSFKRKRKSETILQFKYLKSDFFLPQTSTTTFLFPVGTLRKLCFA